MSVAIICTLQCLHDDTHALPLSIRYIKMKAWQTERVRVTIQFALHFEVVLIMKVQTKGVEIPFTLTLVTVMMKMQD